jgi:hypothetical protein
MDGGSSRRKAATYKQNNINTEYTHTDIHTSGGIRPHDPRVRAGEDGSCLRPRDRCDRHIFQFVHKHRDETKQITAYSENQNDRVEGV